MVRQSDGGGVIFGGGEDSLNYREYFAGAYPAWAKLVIDIVSYDLREVLRDADIGLTDLRKGIADGSDYFSVEILFEAAVGFYDFKVNFDLGHIASLQ
jgi:hypothetical protein